MISYFKYTGGGALTLDGEDYRGMFNVTNNTFYTNSKLTASSKVLSSNSTYIAQVFKNRLNFNNTVFTQLTVLENTAKAYSRTSLTYDKLNEILNELNKNNILLYSKIVTYNNDIFNIYAKNIDTLPITYCLTAADDTFSAKYLPAERFELPADSDILRARSTNRRSSLFITLSTEDLFSYYSNDIKIEGYFNTQNSTLSTSEGPFQLDGIPHYDRHTDLVYFVRLTKYSIYYYNPSSECREMVLIDTVPLSLTNGVVNNKLVTFGLNYRCAIVDNNNKKILEISSKNKSPQIYSIGIEDLGMDTIISTCQRFEDDAYAILYIIDGEVRLRLYDLQQLLRESADFNKLDEKNIVSQRVILFDNSVSGGLGFNHTIEFSPFDSDIIICRSYVGGMLKDVQFRSISNPGFPIAYFDGVTRTGNVGQYVPLLNNFITHINNIPSSLDDIGNGLPFPMYDIAFDVRDTIRYFIFYKDSIEVSHITNMFNSCVPLNLQVQYYNNISRNDGSIGLTLNNALYHIIYDTLTLYKMCISLVERDTTIGTYIGELPVLLPDITDYDLHMYDNESFNIGVFDRICNSLQQIQKNIARSITQPV